MKTRGFDDLHAALFTESRTRGRRQQREVGNPGTLCRKHFQESTAEPQISPLRYPGFPVENRGVDHHHAVFFKENRTRGRCQQREVGNPGTLRSR